MKSIATLVVLAALLNGCAQIAEYNRSVEAERQERAQQCAEQGQGWVIYGDQCMSPQAAFAADQNEQNRIMIQAACFSNGGNWQMGSSLRCGGANNDMNVNVYP